MFVKDGVPSARSIADGGAEPDRRPRAATFKSVVRESLAMESVVRRS